MISQDEALKTAGDTLIAAFPDTYGSITFNLQGKRKTVHANIMSKIVLDNGEKSVKVDLKESKQLLCISRCSG